MKRERVLSLLILSEFVLFALSVVSDYALKPFLPSALRAYLIDQSAASPFADTMLTSMWIIVAASTILAWIGLLNLIRAARALYLTSWAAYLILLLLRGSVVGTAASFAIQMMMALVGGAIIGVIYFSDLRARFRPLSEAFGSAVENSA
jgi:hypothetical protein